MNAAQACSGGFNLLPWRARIITRARRQRLYEWGMALLLGLACAAPVAGWQAWQQRRLDAARADIEHSLAQLHAPLTEYSRLMRDEAAHRQRLETATLQARPLTHLLDLFDALGAARANGLALQRIVHTSRETVLHATVDDEASADAWLARLRTVRDAQGVSVPELKRVAPARHAAPASSASVNAAGNASAAGTASTARAASAADGANAGAPLQMTVHVLWRAAQ